MRSVNSPGKIFNVEDGLEELRSSGDRVSFLKSDLDRARRQVSVLQEKLMKLMGSQEKAEFLANSNTELTTLLVAAEAKCSELTEKNKVVDEKCEKLGSSLRNTQEQLESTRSKNSELDLRVKEMDKLVGELKAAEERSRLLEAENSKAQAERLDAEVALEKERTKVLEERETQQQQLKQANDHRNAEVEMRLNTEALCTELEGRLEAITRDHDRLSREHTEAKSEIEMLADRNAQLVNQNQELMAANAEAHKHALAQDAQNTELEENLAALVTQYEKLEQLRCQWECDAKRAQAKMEDLKAECYTLDGRVGVLSDENKAMDDEIHAKAAKCEAVEAMYRALELKYVECEGSVGELRRTSKSVQALEVSSAALEARALNAESKVDALERQLQQAQAQSSVVQAQYDGELQRRTELEAALSNRSEKLSALQDNVALKDQRVKSLEQQLDKSLMDQRQLEAESHELMDRAESSVHSNEKDIKALMAKVEEMTSIANAAVAESEALKARNSALQESVAIAKYEAVRHHRNRKEKEDDEFIIAEDADAGSEVARRLSAMEAAVTRLREDQSLSALPSHSASPRARLSHPAVLRNRDHEASPSSAMSGSAFNSGGSSRMHERDVRPSRSRSVSPVQYSPGRATPRIETAVGSTSRRHYRPGNSSPGEFTSPYAYAAQSRSPGSTLGRSPSHGYEARRNQYDSHYTPVKRV